MSKVNVIVVKCAGVDDNCRSYGDRLVDATYDTVEEATAQADPHRRQGVSVIVRPTYNESDDKGRFFREWRSFHGEAFKECRWSF